MWLKLLLLISTATFALAAKGPRKLYKVENFDEELPETVPFAPFRDPYDNIDYRLPNNTRPIHYDVWLKTDIDQGIFDFSGRVTIHIEALENTNEITLHYRQLTIVDVKLQRATGATLQSNVPFSVNETLEFVIIKPTQRLISGSQYRIVINYIGELRDDDAGFYRSSYLEGTTRKWLATTQFESTDARHAFPW
jgi:aminopeptidase N